MPTKKQGTWRFGIICGLQKRSTTTSGSRTSPFSAVSVRRGTTSTTGTQTLTDAERRTAMPSDELRLLRLVAKAAMDVYAVSIDAPDNPLAVADAESDLGEALTFYAEWKCEQRHNELKRLREVATASRDMLESVKVIDVGAAGTETTYSERKQVT